MSKLLENYEIVDEETYTNAWDKRNRAMCEIEMSDGCIEITYLLEKKNELEPKEKEA